MTARMIGKTCSLCDAEMVSQATRTPSGEPLIVSFCRVCDRRRCSGCGHHEQDVFATKCSNCGSVGFK